jgi:hypothetical protein
MRRAVARPKGSIQEVTLLGFSAAQLFRNSAKSKAHLYTTLRLRPRKEYDESVAG